MATWLVSRKKEAITTFATVALLFTLYNAYLQTQDGLQLFTLPQNISTEHPVVDNAADYRRLLSTVNPLDGLPHSKTLGVASRIYVIGLPDREDRRIIMENLEKAMGGQNVLYVYYIC
jgi:hypothetical protein